MTAAMRRGGAPRARARASRSRSRRASRASSRAASRGDARVAERVAAAPSGRCEAAAGRRGLAAAVVGATAVRPESCARARATRDARAGRTRPPERRRRDARMPRRGTAAVLPTIPNAPRAIVKRVWTKNGVVRTEFLPRRYIVRFSEYKMIGAHRAALQALGRPSNEKELDPALYGTFLDDATTTPDEPTEEKIEWAFIERRNKAAAFPTDFAVAFRCRERRTRNRKNRTSRIGSRRVTCVSRNTKVNRPRRRRVLPQALYLRPRIFISRV